MENKLIDLNCSSAGLHKLTIAQFVQFAHSQNCDLHIQLVPRIVLMQPERKKKASAKRKAQAR